MPTKTGGSVQQCSSGQSSAPQLQMLERIAGIIGGGLSVDQVGYQGDFSWIKFHFPAMVDSQVMMTLDAKSHLLFDGIDLHEWQILKSTDRAEGWGIWLRHLDNVKTKIEYKCGVLYY